MRKLWRAGPCLALVALACAVPLNAWAADEESQDTFVAVRAGTILTVAGEAIHDGIIVIRNGVIETVGKNVEYPRGAEIVHAEDLVVMPGLINPCSLAGAGRFRRSGVNANLEAADDFIFDPRFHEKLIAAGFTAMGLRPPGSGIPGLAYAYLTCGADQKDRTLSESAYLFVTMTNPSREKKLLKNALSQAKKEIEKVEKARKDWEEKQKKIAEEKKKAEEKKQKSPEEEKKKEEGDKGSGGSPEKKAPSKGEEEKTYKPPVINPVYQPLVDLIQEKEGARAVVMLSRASDFLHFKEAADGFDFGRTFLIGSSRGGRVGASGGDIYLEVDAFGEAKAAIILEAVITYKTWTANRVNLPALFAAAGCEVSLKPTGDSIESHAGFLGRVGNLVKGGMKREDALKAVTLHPARVLGLSERLGSIEGGKDANLLFLTKDPFDALSRVAKVMIRGKFVAEGRSIQ